MMCSGRRRYLICYWILRKLESKVKYGIEGKLNILVYHGRITIELSGNIHHINFDTTSNIQLKCNAFPKK